MRILFLNSEFPPLGGGAAQANQELFRAFANIAPDLAIDCVTASIDHRPSKTALSERITIFRVPIGHKEHSLHYQSIPNLLRYLLNAARCSRALIAKQHYNLVHAFFTLPAGHVAWQYRRQLPYLISLRGSDVPGYSQRFRFLYRWITPWMKRIWQEASAVVANSTHLADLAHQSAPHQKIQVIPNGVDHEYFFPAASEPPLSEGFVLLTVCRFVARKNLDLIIRAVAQLKALTPPVRLMLVGDGPLDASLRSLVEKLGVSDRVVFVGAVEHEALPPLYRSAHCFVLLSSHEGMSNTTLEAIASGLPVILSSESGAEELAAGNGVVVPATDLDAITDAIQTMMNSTEQRKTFCKNSRAKALGYTWEKAAEAYLRLYQQISKAP